MPRLTPELEGRVQAILADRASRRQKLIEWHQTAKPDTSTTTEDWRAHLDPAEFEVLRQKGTERKGGEYDKFHREDGHFACRGCGKPLYTASAKFKSSCGWPAFDKCFRDSVVISEDRTLEPTRIEITCAGCDGHLGHVFAGERLTPTNERHCVNSVSILYVEAENAADERLAQGLASSMPQAEEKVLTMQKLARIRKGADHGTLATSQGATPA